MVLPLLPAWVAVLPPPLPAWVAVLPPLLPARATKLPTGWQAALLHLVYLLLLPPAPLLPWQGRGPAACSSCHLRPACKHSGVIGGAAAAGGFSHTLSTYTIICGPYMYILRHATCTPEAANKQQVGICFSYALAARALQRPSAAALVTIKALQRVPLPAALAEAGGRTAHCKLRGVEMALQTARELPRCRARLGLSHGRRAQSEAGMLLRCHRTAMALHAQAFRVLASPGKYGGAASDKAVAPGRRHSRQPCTCSCPTRVGGGRPCAVRRVPPLPQLLQRCCCRCSRCR